MIWGTSLLSWDDMKRVWLCMCGLDKYKTNITIIQEHVARYKSFPGHLLRRSRLSGCCAEMERIGQASAASPHLHLQSNPRQAIWLLAATCQSTSTSEKKNIHIFSLSLCLCGLVKGSASVTSSRRQRRCLPLPLTKRMRGSHGAHHTDQTHGSHLCKSHSLTHTVKELHWSSQSKPTWTSTSVNTHWHASRRCKAFNARHPAPLFWFGASRHIRVCTLHLCTQTKVWSSKEEMVLTGVKLWGKKQAEQTHPPPTPTPTNTHAQMFSNPSP